VTPTTEKISSRTNRETGFAAHTDLAASLVVLAGFLARIWAASGTFFNPDEALHFRLANQVSVTLAYKQALTASHPPLLILLLYFWRALGTSELWLRLPSVMAGTAFCWFFFQWLARVVGPVAGFIGLVLVALLPPEIALSAEVRQYALLLAFLASALYFFERALEENSAGWMASSLVCLYLGMLSHYSAFLFAAAFGVYALIRIFVDRVRFLVAITWCAGQVAALALAMLLYKVHLSRLGAGDSRTVLHGWMSEHYLRRSYFESGHDNPVLFLIGHSFGVFQFFFGQLVVGDLAGLLFLVGVWLFLSGRMSTANPSAPRPAGAFLLLAFAITCGVSLAHLYPYGGTRQVAFLIIPAVAGVSVAVAWIAGWRWGRGVGLALVMLAACVVFGKARPPHMNRSDQSRTHMAAAMEFVRHNVPPSAPIFVDYQSSLILGNYLCQQQPISLDTSVAGFESFSCGGTRVIGTNYKGTWGFSSENFMSDWQWLVQTYSLRPGEKVWIIQTGWGIDLPNDLRKHFAEFRELHEVSFGNNIKMFELTVGQPTPAIQPDQILY
jgi:uncharacterized membrane protein